MEDVEALVDLAHLDHLLIMNQLDSTCLVWVEVCLKEASYSYRIHDYRRIDEFNTSLISLEFSEGARPLSLQLGCSSASEENFYPLCLLAQGREREVA